MPVGAHDLTCSNVQKTRKDTPGCTFPKEQAEGNLHKGNVGFTQS